MNRPTLRGLRKLAFFLALSSVTAFEMPLDETLVLPPVILANINASDIWLLEALSIATGAVVEPEKTFTDIMFGQDLLTAMIIFVIYNSVVRIPTGIFLPKVVLIDPYLRAFE